MELALALAMELAMAMALALALAMALAMALALALAMALALALAMELAMAMALAMAMELAMALALAMAMAMAMAMALELAMGGPCHERHCDCVGGADMFINIWSGEHNPTKHETEDTAYREVLTELRGEGYGRGYEFTVKVEIGHGFQKVFFIDYTQEVATELLCDREDARRTAYTYR